MNWTNKTGIFELFSDLNKEYSIDNQRKIYVT